MKLIRILALLGLTVLLAACGSEGVEGESIPSTTANPVSSTTGSPGAIPSGDEVVRVAITGYLAEGENGIAEVCPGAGGPCPGILLLGGAPSLEDPSSLVRLVGIYDGRNILVEQWTELEAPEPDFSNPCGLSGSGFGNPPAAASAALDGEVSGLRERLAGMWWDNANQVMTIWLTGEEVDDAREAFESAIGGGMSVCVMGGAAYSEDQLLEIQSSLDRILDYAALGVQASWTDVVNNRVEVSSELLDVGTRELLEAEYGEAVVVQAFIEVLNGSVADLPEPQPTVAGNVELVTQQTRGGGGMDALGHFEVMFDVDRGCVYFPGDEESNNGEPGTGGRTLPVWPFGYTAESDPLRIYDFDGNLVAEEGDTIQMGGGFVSIEFTEADDDCAATGAWIASSPPVVIAP